MSFSKALPFSIAAALMFSFSNAFAYVAPEVIQQGDVTYITGGIGEGEAQALEAGKSKYQLHIISADENGAYVGDTQLIIRNKDGMELLNADIGPLFYANLPAGRYSLEATSGDQTKEQKITIKEDKPVNIVFRWKFNPDDGSSN